MALPIALRFRPMAFNSPVPSDGSLTLRGGVGTEVHEDNVVLSLKKNNVDNAYCASKLEKTNVDKTDCVSMFENISDCVVLPEIDQQNAESEKVQHVPGIDFLFS